MIEQQLHESSESGNSRQIRPTFRIARLVLDLNFVESSPHDYLVRASYKLLTFASLTLALPNSVGANVALKYAEKPEYILQMPLLLCDLYAGATYGRQGKT